MKKIIYIAMVTLLSTVAYAQRPNLDKLPEKERNEYLLSTSKIAALKLAAPYFREIATPIIEREVMTEDSDYVVGKGDNGNVYIGRTCYNVNYLYDPAVEFFEKDYAVQVSIWEDSGIVFRVLYGTGYGLVQLDNPDILRYMEEHAPEWGYEKRPPRKN